MRSRLLPALAGLTALTLTGLVLPANIASAAPDCTPVIDTASLVAGPATIAVPAKGTKLIHLAASFSAPCGKSSGSDLTPTILLKSQGDEVIVLDAGTLVESDGGDRYSFDGKTPWSSRDLHNYWAGTWTAAFMVGDWNDEAVSDEVMGPTFQMLRATKATASAPATVKKGKKVTVTGKLTRANWDKRKDGAYAKVPVKLQFKAKNGSYADVKTINSSSKGKLSAAVTATVDGSYRFVYAGNSTSAAATSKADVVDVR